MTLSQDNLHDTALPKVKHTEPGVRLCFYHKLRNSQKKSFLSVFLSLWWIREKDDPVTGFSRSRFNFLYGFE